MTKTLEHLTRETVRFSLPLFKQNSVNRLQHLFEIGKQSLSLAKLAEAHWDAIAILSEAEIKPVDHALYAVWASEIPNQQLILNMSEPEWTLTGTKMFCSGTGIVDRALLTATMPHPIMIDLDLSYQNTELMQISNSAWKTTAFQDTLTSTIQFNRYPIDKDKVILTPNWYTERTGFWQGALGPAACWAGGAAALCDYALANKRQDPHTLAHLGALTANRWVLQSILHSSACELDALGDDTAKLHILALKVRHLIEQTCTDTLRRFARAYGPYPLACDTFISQTYHELDLFLRQSHGERDLESLGKALKEFA